MKKVVLFASTFALLSFMSCKKSVDCECTTTTDGVENGSSAVTDHDGDCSDFESEVSFGGSTSKTTCVEK